MTREHLLLSPFYKRKFKDIYKLIFTADLDEISDFSCWNLPNPSYVEKNTPLWIIVESKILNKRIWITKDFGRLKVSTAQLDLHCDSTEYHNSYERKYFQNQKQMSDYLKMLLEPCLKEKEKIQDNEEEIIL